MLNKHLRTTLHAVARFYDQRKVGDGGSLGFRRSSDLAKVVACLEPLIQRNILMPQKSLFLDLGCADGRVNVLLSYLVKKSIGIELDEWTLDEYVPLKTGLEATLMESDLAFPPDNIFLFNGDSLDDVLHEAIDEQTGVSFGEFDLFYTYLTMYEEFAELVGRKAKKGAVFMVYGLERILPKFNGLHLLTPERPIEDTLTLYKKR